MKGNVSRRDPSGLDKTIFFKKIILSLKVNKVAQNWSVDNSQ